MIQHFCDFVAYFISLQSRIAQAFCDAQMCLENVGDLTLRLFWSCRLSSCIACWAGDGVLSGFEVITDGLLLTSSSSLSARIQDDQLYHGSSI